MERETFTFKEGLKVYLNQMAQRMMETYGVDVWFAEIMGKRWSYIAGRKKEKDVALLPPRRIELTGRFGIVSDGWERVPTDEAEIIISLLREAVRSYEQ